MVVLVVLACSAAMVDRVMSTVRSTVLVQYRMPPTILCTRVTPSLGIGGIHLWGGSSVPLCRIFLEPWGRENAGVLVRLYVGVSVTISWCSLSLKNPRFVHRNSVSG